MGVRACVGPGGAVNQNARRLLELRDLWVAAKLGILALLSSLSMCHPLTYSKMKRRRAVVTGTLLGLVILGAAASDVRALDTPPMSWWGYWAGRKGDTKPGAKFLRRGEARKFTSNIVLVHAGRDPGELAMLRRAFDSAHAHGRDVGVILMIDNVLRNIPNGIDASFLYYGAVEYDGWHQRLAQLSDALHAPGPDGWRPVDTIVAIAGFDEVNVYQSLLFNPVGDGPHPIPYAMELAQAYFPEVPDRGHVWKLGSDPTVDAPPNALTLEGSTLPFAYHYAAYAHPSNATTVPLCPHEGTFPAASLPSGSFAQQDESGLRDFVDAVNAVRGTTDTPVVFIPYSNIIGLTRNPIQSRGVGCSLEALWYHTRCLASQGGSWATQVRGFLAWQWARSRPIVDGTTGELLDPGWPGTQRDRILQASGKWIGRNLSFDPCEWTP